MRGTPWVTLLAAASGATHAAPAEPTIEEYRPFGSAECESEVYPVTDPRLLALAEILLRNQFDRMPYTCLPLQTCDWAVDTPSEHKVYSCGDAVLWSYTRDVEASLDSRDCDTAFNAMSAGLVQWRLLHAFTDLIPVGVDSQVYGGKSLCSQAARFIHECGEDPLPSSHDDTFILSDFKARCALMDPCWQESSPWGGQMPRSWSRRYRCQKPPKIKAPPSSGSK